jgi:hypothetical protein
MHLQHQHPTDCGGTASLGRGVGGLEDTIESFQKAFFVNRSLTGLWSKFKILNRQKRYVFADF